MTDIGRERGIFQVVISGATGVGDIQFNHTFTEAVNLTLHSIEVRPTLIADNFYFTGIASSRLFSNTYVVGGYPNRLILTFNSTFNFWRKYDLHLGKVWMNTTERVQLFDDLDGYTFTPIDDVDELILTFEWYKA